MRRRAGTIVIAPGGGTIDASHLRVKIVGPFHREVWPSAATITVPALVVGGGEDVITPPAEAERVAKSIRGARLAVVPGCGHLVPIEDPAAFAQQLGTFWRGG